MPLINLQSSEGDVFSVEVEVAIVSLTIKTMLDTLGMEGIEYEIVPLPNVDSDTLARVIDWSTYHQNDPPLEEDDEFYLCDWDYQFLDVDTETIFNLARASNYLDIPSLLEATSVVMAERMSWMSPHEVSATYKIMTNS
ncbi:S-phase kinase-associated protein 1-like [Coccinella septempunctata]|uniref:S-phase kinase-associated protein 1-like n=1 Tax=Coccinella septempunctata TaxID=41139 RepID=UPI001D071E54|nr:S-phase kinase-associated protein 1-like [Coccinella septempunctata]